MKDRWKIFWISFLFSIILAALFLFLGFSFRKVEIRNWGIVLYDYYKIIDSNQSPRTSGNYLIGLDHKFLQFPKGFLHQEFTVKILTKDKSLIDIQGIYVGKLVYKNLLNMTLTFGDNYQKILFTTVQRLFRQATEQFSLNQLISDRLAVDSYVRNYVKSNIQTKYEWIQTKYVNLGQIKTNLKTNKIKEDLSLQQNYLKMINKTLANKKKQNIYESGGYQLLQNIENQNAQLFKNVITRLKSIAYKLQNINKTQQFFPALTYTINDLSIPIINKNIEFQIFK